MQYFPREWLSDAKVSQCRPATRGIWWDAISAMHEIDRCGQMLIANHGGKNGGVTKTNGSDSPPGSTSERRTSRGDRVYIPRQ
jgi:hypothetical protein